ncbi:MAG: hypothetical protein RR555_09330, partial [Bacteroidales bacterium]
MRKKILLKYASGEASQTQREEVLEWAGKNKANELYLARLQNLWISQNIPQEMASVMEMEKMAGLLDEKIRREKDKVEKTAVNGQVTDCLASERLPANQLTSKISGSYRIKKWIVWGVAASIVLFFSTGLYF